MASDRPCPRLPSACALGSRCCSECGERQLLMSCLLNCRPPDCAAKITSLSDETTLMVIFFTLKTSTSGFLLLPHFSEVVVVSAACYYYYMWCQGQRWVLCRYYSLVEFSQDLCKPWLLEEEIWSLPRATPW